MFALLALVASSWLPGAAGSSTPAVAAGPRLKIKAPAQVELGQSFEIRLAVTDAVDIAGFESHVLFDPTAAHFSALRQRNNDLRRFGRDVSPLTVAELPDGAAIGFYSCSVEDCVTRKGAKKVRGGNGALVLGRLFIGTDKPGTLEIKFDATKFVDATGNPVAVTDATQTISVQVGPAGAGPRYAAPRGEWRLANNAPAPAQIAAELTGDGVVTHADAMEVALDWTRVRENGNPCADLPQQSRDLNRDGCIDVADLQLVAAQYTDARTGAVKPIAARTVQRVAGRAVQSVTSVQPQAEPQQVTPSAAFVVDTTADSGDISIGDGACQASVATAGKCTLRAAIQEANVRAGADTVYFNIPGGGVQTISLTAALPALSDATGGTTIDGYTQPGATVNTDPFVSNARLMVQIAGGGPTRYDGIPITAKGNLVRGLALYNLRRAIGLYGAGATDNVVVGNFIGTDAGGNWQTNTDVFYSNGVYLEQGAARNRIGGPAAAERNIISGNARNGISAYYERTDSNLILNNLIGLGPRGDKRLPNRGQGIDINADSAFNVIGGNYEGARNVLSGNALAGVEISHGTLTTQNKIEGNYIGTDPYGTAQGAAYTYNGEWGVHIEDGANNSLVAGNVIGNNRLGGVRIENPNTVANRVTNNRIGIGVDGSAIPNAFFGVRIKIAGKNNIIGPGNIITNNPAGVSIEYLHEDFNTITQNSIYNNSSLGIDLGPSAGVSYNDAGDTDTGANEGLNYPVITAATPSQVRGTACAEAVVPKPCTVEVFLAEPLASDRSAGKNGQGRTFLAAATTNGSGQFVATVSNVPLGAYVTATATDASGNTSEFSPNRVVANGTTSPTPPPPPPSNPDNLYASDSFSRQVTDGWGVADIGGGYALQAPSRPTVDYDVGGGVGTMTTTAANQYHSAYLTSVSARDVDISFKVRTDKLATGGYAFTYFVARRVATGTEYLGRIGFDGSGNILLQAARSQDGSITLLGSQVTVPGLRQSPNTFLRVRGQVVGADPTTIRFKVFADGQAEPTNWQLSITDSTPALQASGAVGFRTYVSSKVTSVPIVFGFDDYRVAPINTTAPTPTPPAPTPTPPGTVVSDCFSRSVGGGWGSAEKGGAYSLIGSASSFAVNGTKGTMLAAANATRAAYLAGVSLADLEATLRVRTDKSSTGGSQIAYITARRTSSGNSYQARLRFATDGRLMMVAQTVVAGTTKLLGGERPVSGVLQAANTDYWMRVRVAGTNPTTLQMKVWPDGRTEPASWQYSASDSTSTLQAAGAVGLQAYLSSSATNAPVKFSFDDFGVFTGAAPGNCSYIPYIDR